ncbi:hypothetical protein [Prevotella pallens]|uniref:hypothetical protein n=1 Tax=Prevotella pallens TaxID=60133 RepID=UPI0028D4CDE6|nr:hypothetical protein [Prevotella pallens]
MGVYVYAGTINRPLQLLTDCDNTADGLPITWRTLCKTLNVHPQNWLRTDCGCAANGLPNIADGLPKRCKTRCIIRHSAQQCPNIQT